MRFRLSGKTVLTEGDLRGIRATVEESFPDTVTVRRFPELRDDYNQSYRDTANPDDTTYAGRLIQRTSTEQTADGQVDKTEWSVLLPHDADVDAADQILVGGTAYEPSGDPIHNPSPGESTHLRVPLERVVG